MVSFSLPPQKPPPKTLSSLPPTSPPISSHQSEGGQEAFQFLGIRADSVEKKMGFLSEDLNSGGFCEQRNPSMAQGSPARTKKSRVSRDQKRRRFRFLRGRASAVSARVCLFLRVSLRRRRRECREGFSRPFWDSAPAFLPGHRGNGSERPTKSEMIKFRIPRRVLRRNKEASLDFA